MVTHVAGIDLPFTFRLSAADETSSALGDSALSAVASPTSTENRVQRISSGRAVKDFASRQGPMNRDATGKKDMKVSKEERRLLSQILRQEWTQSGVRPKDENSAPVPTGKEQKHALLQGSDLRGPVNVHGDPVVRPPKTVNEDRSDGLRTTDAGIGMARRSGSLSVPNLLDNDA